MAKEYDYLFHITLLGDNCVGKTSIFSRFCDQAFSTTYIHTVGVDFRFPTITLDGKRIKLQIWDTAGLDQYKTITSAYYRGAWGIMLVYDITNERGFDRIRHWIRLTEEHAATGVERMLIGNKCDMNDKRAVEKERGEAFAQEYGFLFFETSAKDDINIDEAFHTLIRVMKNRMDVNSVEKPSTDSSTQKLGSNSMSKQSNAKCSLL